MPLKPGQRRHAIGLVVSSMIDCISSLSLPSDPTPSPAPAADSASPVKGAFQLGLPACARVGTRVLHAGFRSRIESHDRCCSLHCGSGSDCTMVTAPVATSTLGCTPKIVFHALSPSEYLPAFRLDDGFRAYFNSPCLRLTPFLPLCLHILRLPLPRGSFLAHTPRPSSHSIEPLCISCDTLEYSLEPVKSLFPCIVASAAK